MTETGFTELNDTQRLEELLDQSGEQPVILFKHSDTCGISARAYREMTKLEKPVALVTVQKVRALSNEIEIRFSLPHETPQVLVVRDRKLAWSASHFRITADAVTRAVEEAAQRSAPDPDQSG
ncbi:MAG TPA: bacillithiol system redox-active protein YtxJ [Pyrinomonadaceae bacterium]